MNSKLNPSIDKIKRQSFDARICDDLCEVILQFLPLNDVLRLECVSKKFQRTILDNVLNFDANIDNYNQNKLIPFKSELKLIAIESLLKKCPNIHYLFTYFDRLLIGSVEYNLIIDLIIKYCNNLTQFYGYFDLMNDTNREKFIQKFGSKLKILQLLDTFEVNVLKLVPNIEDLKQCITEWHLSDLSKIKLRKLKKLHLCLNFTSDQNIINTFSVLIENSPQIEDLYIYCLAKDITEFNVFLNQISRFKNLVKLDIPGLNSKFYQKSVQQIGTNCSKLKAIRTNIYIDFKNDPQMNELLSPLMVFKHLKRLDLLVFYNDLYEMQNFSFKIFKGFQYLTHLSLDLGLTISDSILSDIGINLPKLKYLKIENKFIATEETSNILSRLSSLETIKLNITDNYMKDIIKTKLSEHKKYKTIVL